MYIHTENEVAVLKHSKLLIEDDMCMANKKYENISQDQRSRSNVTKFQSLLAFPMRHILIKLHQFPTSSFLDFVRTETYGHTDATKNNTCSQHARR